MGIPLEDILAKMSPKQRAYVEKRGEELLQEYLTLQELRKAQHLTQQRMAEMLGINQENISRLERRSDLMLSTLRSYVEAMGGNLKLMVEFPGRPPVTLQGFGQMDPPE